MDKTRAEAEGWFVCFSTASTENAENLCKVDGGTPGRIRTCGLQLRRLTPYPLGYGRTYSRYG